MKERFSDRIGKTIPSEVLQIDGMSNELRNTIWNYILTTFMENENQIHKINENLCFGFFKIPVDELPYETWRQRNWLKDKLFALEWYDVYNLLEYLSYRIEDISNKRHNEHDVQYVLNVILENENAGFRFIDGKLSQITNEEEINSIENSIAESKAKKMYGTAKHFETAIELFSKRPNPDFRNSIKESISAVESLVKFLTGEKGGGLDKALNLLDDTIKFHPAFKQGLLKLYGYTSDDKGGIRHAILEEKEIGFDEAKYMLVSCSAFVNFIIAKVEKVGLLKNG